MIPPVSVLIVDDAVDLRGLLRRVLERDERITVVGEAGDGAEALTLAASLQPEVVVLDLSMPVRGGLDVIAELAVTSRVVVMSGYSAGQFAATCIERGASRYIEKGRPLTELVDAVVAEGGRHG